MPNQDVAEKIRQFITTNFLVTDPAGLSPQVSFFEQGIVDSTGVLEVVSFLEETFGITIADSEMLPENLDSLQGLNSFIERKLSAPPYLRLLPKEQPPSGSRTPSGPGTSNPAAFAQTMSVRGERDPAS